MSEVEDLKSKLKKAIDKTEDKIEYYNAYIDLQRESMDYVKEQNRKLHSVIDRLLDLSTMDKQLKLEEWRKLNIDNPQLVGADTDTP